MDDETSSIEVFGLALLSSANETACGCLDAVFQSLPGGFFDLVPEKKYYYAVVNFAIVSDATEAIKKFEYPNADLAVQLLWNHAFVEIIFRILKVNRNVKSIVR